MARKMFALMFLTVTVAAMAACNTVAGAGEDTQKAGRAIERSAERNGANR